MAELSRNRPPPPRQLPIEEGEKTSKTGKPDFSHEEQAVRPAFHENAGGFQANSAMALMLTYAFVFGAICPLAPLLLYLWVVSRQHWQRTALVYVFQRPHPQASPGGGWWAESLVVIVCLALAVQLPLALCRGCCASASSAAVARAVPRAECSSSVWTRPTKSVAARLRHSGRNLGVARHVRFHRCAVGGGVRLRHDQPDANGKDERGEERALAEAGELGARVLHASMLRGRNARNAGAGSSWEKVP